MKINVLIILAFFVSFKFAAQEKPNIVLLFVDDYGWSDIGYRNQTFHTPSLNQLKKESLEFTRAYIPTPTCSPSRASLLTGKEAIRLGMPRHIALDENEPDAEYGYWEKDPAHMPSRNYLPLEEVTYAERLKEFGYYNMFIGKWHLGQPGRYPIDQGFDAQYGTTDAGHPKNYYYSFFPESEDPEGFLKSGPKTGDYLTNVLTDGAVKFIEDYDKNQPFMLSFWYYSVHGPSIGRKDLVDDYKKEGLDSSPYEDKYEQHAAMVSAMDESVGRVRQALKEKGIADNTIIIVLSDQGGAYTNTPLSGGKKGGNTLGEGGARVPFMIYYPKLTKPNTEVETPVQSIDLYPTLVEIASGKKYSKEDKQINGVSLMPLIRGKNIKKRNLFFYRSYEDQYAAIMNGDWKLIKYRSGLYHLFNIKEDISEKNDLYGKGLKIEAKLKKDLDKWEEEAVPVYLKEHSKLK